MIIGFARIHIQNKLNETCWFAVFDTNFSGFYPKSQNYSAIDAIGFLLDTFANTKLMIMCD